MNIASIYSPIKDQMARIEEKIVQIGQTPTAGLNEILHYVLNISGKRLRPAVALLTSQIVPNKDYEKPVLMATAIELLHIATLIHDDTVDNSDTRHGKATIGSIWGKDVAVLLGDYVFAASTTFVCETGNIRVISRFSETLKELSEGEIHERLTSFDLEQTRDDYWRRIYNKTASLFSTAAQSGAILSGLNEEYINALKCYGKNLGIAFQIVDDILDFEGTEEEIGKPVGADLIHGTLTLPSIILLERYPKNNPIQDIFNGVNPEENLKIALDQIRSSSIIQESYTIAEEFITKANKALKKLPPGVSKNSLLDLLDYVLHRNS